MGFFYTYNEDGSLNVIDNSPKPAEERASMSGFDIDAARQSRINAINRTKKSSKTKQGGKTKATASVDRSNSQKPQQQKRNNAFRKKADAASIHAELKEMQRKSAEIMNDILKAVQQTGTTAQLGNFKISKLK